ncbi:MAG: hypothetical protein H7641_02500 [Candidatus Heimdallarchaeota archaeon]|nr:hypothetical protein [Candidatus Heimdallarchaeota archaeon]MCK4876434.1 hypothetical protein [Candidatus Heimdallarchaeota archaeon]
MKWEDAKEKYPEELFNTLKELCEEFNESVNREKRLLTIFCNWCYKTKGSLCFPCVDIKRLYLQKYDSDLEQILSKYD